MPGYPERFSDLADGHWPHPYQERVAEQLFERRHLIVRAPTGAGKTLAVLAPFLVDRERIGVRGMIYVLPLRTLVEAVYEEAHAIGAARGFRVAMQTGERADAEFFHDADIIVTTFDQLLSGLLCEPYGLSNKLWNINAAAMAGKLIVFDEFHLMGPADAFVTALFGTEMFKDLCVSVWMTATATSPLTNRIKSCLNAVEVELSATERVALFEGRGISRRLRTHWEDRLTAQEILKHRADRTLVVVNTVKRAQALYGDLADAGYEPLLLHSRFFSDDRKKKQGQLNAAKLVIATQVIEAGVDISSDVLLTDVSPVNSLMQRAGRCARFANESGTVHVYGVDRPLPYTQTAVEDTISIVTDTDLLNPATCAQWVEEAHTDGDRVALAGFPDGVEKRRDLIKKHVIRKGDSGAAEYIRPGSDTVRVFILENPIGVKPQERQAIQLYRDSVAQLRNQAWVYDGQSWVAGEDVKAAYAVALPPSVAGYTWEKGLILRTSGIIESPPKTSRARPGYGGLKVEPWATHTQGVAAESSRRLAAEGLDQRYAGPVRWAARLHDLGKLQNRWQEWAIARQAARNKSVSVALAHTDYNWETDRGEPRPPRHAAVSALYGDCYLAGLQIEVRLAVLLAVIAHHGGTLTGADKADQLHALAGGALETAELSPLRPVKSVTFFDDLVDDVREHFETVWPLAAILSRVLRLSDQKATSEAGNE